MDAKKYFKAFLSDLRSSFSDTEFTSFKDSDVSDFEDHITPKLLKVLQKDGTLFAEPFTVFGVDISPLFPTQADMFWKHMQSCTFAALLSGNIKDKFGKVADSFKDLWGGTGHSVDEIEKLLGTEESRGKVSEILEFVMSTRLAKIVMGLVETIDISELGIDFENPEELLKTFQDGNNPIIEKISRKIKTTLEDKVRRGEFTKETIMRDIEAIKVKVQAAFGDMFNDMLGGRKADVPAQVLLDNSPEARRARMVARLRRKVGERKTTQ
jgi:hypothetical protein